MQTINLNNYDNIFTDVYPYKIDILGIVVRITTPQNTEKYKKKIVKHIYFKTHGELFDLSETFEDANEKRCRINLTKTSKFSIPKQKESTQYIHNVTYYKPIESAVHFKEFKSPAIEKTSCEIFEIIFKDTIVSGISINAENNLKKVSEEEFLKILNKK